MIDLRCKNCKKLLAKVDTINGAIKCSGCRMIFEYHVFSNLVDPVENKQQNTIVNKQDIE